MKKIIFLTLVFCVKHLCFSADRISINYSEWEFASPSDSTIKKERKRKKNYVVINSFTIKYKPADTTPFYTIDPWWLWSNPKNHIWQSGSDPLISANSNQEPTFLIGNQLYGGPYKRVDPILIYWKKSEQFTNFWE